MFRVTQYRADPDLVEHLVRQSLAAMVWMREKGVRFVPIYGRQAFKIGGKFKFWGGLTVEVVGRRAGPGRQPEEHLPPQRHRDSFMRRAA